MDFNNIYKQSNKELSCGFIVIDTNTEKILAAHPTNKGNIYDIPKGHIEENETELECAIRELKEETGISVSENDDITDNGRFDYLPYKDLHVFTVKVPVDLDKLSCSTTFIDKKSNKELPEMNGYKLVDTVDNFYPSLKPILKQCLK